METQGKDMEDALMQGIFVVKTKDIVEKRVDDSNLKNFLKNMAFPNTHASVTFSPYWKTCAVGVLHRNEQGPTTHLILFSVKAAKCPMMNMALAYGSAWLMAPHLYCNISIIRLFSLLAFTCLF